MWFLQRFRRVSPRIEPNELPATTEGASIVAARVVQLPAARVAEMIATASLKMVGEDFSSEHRNQTAAATLLTLPVAKYAPESEHSVPASPDDEIQEMIGPANGRSIIEVPSALRRALNARTSRQRESSHAELMALLEYEVINEGGGGETPFRDALVALRAVDEAHWSKGLVGRLRCARVWTLIYGPKIGALVFVSALIAGIVRARRGHEAVEALDPTVTTPLLPPSRRSTPLSPRLSFPPTPSPNPPNGLHWRYSYLLLALFSELTFSSWG
jgi:hypothetical protein